MRLSDGASAYVADKAVEWDQCRREASTLRAERGSFNCEHEAGHEYDDDNSRCTSEAVPACWKHWWKDQQGRDCRPPIEEWCEPCRLRQAVHNRYRAAMVRRGALMRQLQRRALTAWESATPPAAIDPVDGIVAEVRRA